MHNHNYRLQVHHPSSEVLGVKCVLEFKAFLNIMKLMQYACHLSKHAQKCLQQPPPPPSIHISVSAVNLWKHKWPHFNYSQVCFWVFLCILSSVRKTLWHCTIQLLKWWQSYEQSFSWTQSCYKTYNAVFVYIH